MVFATWETGQNLCFLASMELCGLGEGNLKSEAKPRILTPHPN